MPIFSVGVRVLEDFDALPLFDAPPLDGPTTKIGSLAGGASVRAIQKAGDFLLLEGDNEDGGEDGPLGWVDASCVAPNAFPAMYQFASDLPDGANLVVRASPQPGAPEVGKISGKDSLVLATGLQGDYISMVYQDGADPSSPPLRGWMLSMTDDRVLLTLKPSLLIVPAPGLPEGAQLRVRAAPEATAPEVGQVSAAPGTVFEAAEKSDEWVRVLLGEEASAWMSSSAQGMSLLEPAQRRVFIMDPELVAQHGDAVKLAVRSAPSQNGTPLGELTCRGQVHCVSARGPWLRVLYKGFKEAWMLSRTDSIQLLVPAASVGGDASSSSNPGEQTPAPPEGADAAPQMDGSRYMVCEKRVAVRSEPEFFATEAGFALAQSVVRVLEEREEVNRAKQTKEVWVRVQLPRSSSEEGCGGAASAGLIEGWIMAFSTKRGATMAEAPDPLAAQVAFQKQEEADQAAATPSATAGPSPDQAAIAEATASAPIPASAAPVDSTAEVGDHMRAAGTSKLREEADSLSMEIGTVAAGELVRVVETSGLWVRVNYRGASDGWVLTANKRGPILSPAEGSPADAAQEFEDQEAAAGSGGDFSTANDMGDDDRQLTGAKAGSTAPSEQMGDVRDNARDATPPSSQPPPPPAAEGPGKASSAVGGQFLTSAGPLKIREEADPFSMDVGTMDKGDIVKVLEASGMWVRVDYRGRQDGWILTANKRGRSLVSVDDGDLSDAARTFDAQEARYAAEVAAAAAATPSADDDDRPLTGAKPAASAVEAEDRALDTGGGGKGSWAPPSEFPPGHEDSPVSEGTTAAAMWGVEAEMEKDNVSGMIGSSGSVRYMRALGPLKIRDEADPFSMDLGVTEKGDLVKVLEASPTDGRWVRVSYRGREDGWILSANKKGPTLDPVEDLAAAAAGFDAQEASFAAAAVAASVASEQGGEDRPLNAGGGKDSSWVPPSEFPPGHEESPVEGGGTAAGTRCLANADKSEGSGKHGDKCNGELASSNGTVHAEYLKALGPLKLRDEADPFSMDLGVTEKGDIVKVLEASPADARWVRVAYRGREDGWILSANKRGPTLVPHEDPASAAADFDAQEASHAAAAAASVAAAENLDDRPLKSKDGNESSWVPPSEFPPGHEESSAAAGTVEVAKTGGEEKEGSGKTLGSDPIGDSAESAGEIGRPEFMQTLGPLKIRDEPDPFSMDLGVTVTGEIVKVLEASAADTRWLRVAYRGREHGWILSANKRGPTLVPLEDPASAAVDFDAQEVSHAAAAAASVAAAENLDDRPLKSKGGNESSWVPPSEFPPGHEESLAATVEVAKTGDEKEGSGKTLGSDPVGHSAELAGEIGRPEFMQTLGPLKIRDEPDPCSMDLGVTATGEIVKVLEESATDTRWLRVAYRGREDGWILSANKRGPTLVPLDDPASAAAGFDAQEASHAAAAASVVAAENLDDRPLKSKGGDKSSWVPPSEFPPGHEESPGAEGIAEVAKTGAEKGGDKEAPGQHRGDPNGESLASSSGSVHPEYMRALGPLKVRNEADPFSMDLGVTERGDIVKVLEASATDARWVRVAYRGREGGWILSANKRGPTLVPLEDPASAAADFDAQEASFAAAAAASVTAARDVDDRPLNAGGGKKSSWAPPSEFPEGQEELLVAGEKEGAEERDGGDPVGELTSPGGTGQPQYMQALGPLKLRDEADPCSMDLGVTQTGDIVKVLEASAKDGRWVRVAYRGREDGWIISANKRGPTLVPLEDLASAAAGFDAQEASFATAEVVPERSHADDRPLNKSRASQVGGDSLLTDGVAADGRGKPVGVRSGSDFGLEGSSALEDDQGAERSEGKPEKPTADAVSTKPWQRRRRAGVRAKPERKSETVGGGEEGDAAGLDGAAPPEKPWLKNKKAVISRGDGTEATAAAAPGVEPPSEVSEPPHGGGSGGNGVTAARDDAAVAEAPIKPWLRVEPSGAEAGGSFGDGKFSGGGLESTAAPSADDISEAEAAVEDGDGGGVGELEAVSPSIRASTSVGSEATVGSRGQGPGDEAVVHADLEITSPPPPAHGVVSTTPSGQPTAGRRLSGALENTTDRASKAAAPAARTPAPGTPAKSPTTGRDLGYRALMASGTRTRTSETPRLSFFKSTTAGRDSGYRALLASGGRSPEERETRFLGSQMLVLPDGVRNAWDDIVDEVLQKAPPPYVFPRRRAHDYTAFPSRSPRAPEGRGSNVFSRPRPRSPPIAPSPPKAPAPTSYDGGYTGRSSGDEMDVNHEIRGQQGASPKKRPQSWALAPEILGSDPFSEPIEATTAGLAKKTTPRPSSQMTRSAEESLRERIAKLGARHPRPEGDKGGARRTGALGHAHTFRSYGSLTSGIDGGNADPLRSPALSSRGGGGAGGLGSPSATNLFFTQEALGNLSDQMASLRLSAEENRENRKQVMTRRLSRGGSFSIRRSIARDSADPAEGKAGEAGEVAAAEAAALGASPAAAQAAADAAIAEARASRRRSARARSRSEAGAEAEPVAPGILPGAEDLDHEENDLVGHTRSSTFGQTELHVPEPDPSGASEEGYDARDDQGPSSSASSLLGKQDDLVDGWPRVSDAATEDGRTGRVPVGERNPRLSELEQPLETPFETPVGSPGSSYDSEAEYDSLRAVLGKVHLGKYFGHFRRSEIRLENLEHLTEEDLMEIGLPMGARKRLLVEVHGIPSARKKPGPPFQVPPSPSGVAPRGNSSQRRREVEEREDQRSQTSSRSSRADSSSSRGEEVFSPPARGGSLAGAGIPAPARGIPSLRTTGVSASSLRARLKQQQQHEIEQGVTGRMSPPLERMASGNGGGGTSVAGRGVFGSGQVDYTRDSGVGLSRREMAGTRPRSAVPRLAEPSPFFGGHGREQRASVGVSGAKMRLAQAAAAEAALDATAATVSQLPTRTSSIPTRTSSIPTRTSSIPRRDSGASRLQTPTARSGISTGIGGVPASRANPGVLRGAVDSGSSPRAAAAATADTAQGTAGGLGNEVAARRSFVPRPSPKERRSFIPRRANRA